MTWQGMARKETKITLTGKIRKENKGRASEGIEVRGYWFRAYTAALPYHTRIIPQP